ncbi:M23 family metallopeptidase [Actinomadura rudentiformis]|uniref:M23 family metallopeptidase n=2 Tax=Actinomadura rudentiformis TaxID=359158 RepID=A0A6H9YD07_9ACTN|nr:M23 family metallopeptidase [Actinomadura rudentiformis]
MPAPDVRRMPAPEAWRMPAPEAWGMPASDAWRWPLGPPAPRIVRGFSPPPAPWSSGHRGVDLAARPGQPVYAAGPGRVSYSGRLAGRGVIAINHGPVRTTYLPVRSQLPLGRPVEAGAHIGVLEASSHCAEPCLHWGLLRDATYLDPLSLVRPRIRLLPLWPSEPTPADAKPEQPPPYEPEPRLDLRDATTATGGAIAGILLALACSLAWRTTRTLTRRKPPTGVIDLTQERRQRRQRQTPSP